MAYTQDYFHQHIPRYSRAFPRRPGKTANNKSKSSVFRSRSDTDRTGENLTVYSVIKCTFRVRVVAVDVVHNNVSRRRTLVHSPDVRVAAV